MINEPRIVDIPVKMEKYYGKGKMLHPTVENVEELIKSIPKGFITTTDLLGKRLAKDAGTDVSCPIRTGNAVKKIGESYSNDTVDFQVPFWRVIRTDKVIMKAKNVEFWAAQIEDEGFQLHFTKSGAIKLEVDAEKTFFF